MVESWRDLVTLTFSVDQNGVNGGRGWSSPAEVWRYVRDNRLVSRCLREVLGLTEWIAVLEFQRPEKGSWPHWHVLLPRRLRKDELSAVRAWMVDKWGVCGRRGVNVRGRRSKDGRVFPKHTAVRYVTQYLSKSECLPSWIAAEYPSFFSQGRSVQSFSAWLSGVPESSSRRVPIGRNVRKCSRRSIGERVAACCSKSEVVVHAEIKLGPEGAIDYGGQTERCGSLAASPEVIWRLAKRVGVVCRPKWYYTRECFEWFEVRDDPKSAWVLYDAATRQRVQSNRRVRRLQSVIFSRDAFLLLLRKCPALVNREIVSPGELERTRWTLAGKVSRAFR